MQVFRANSWLQKNTPLLLSILLTLLMVANLAWQAQSWLARTTESSQSEISNLKTSRSSADPAQLSGLFDSSSSQTHQTAPTTNLRLTLLGSFIHADDKKSSAMIQAEGAPAQRFTVGSEVSAGVRLQAVYRDHVELSRNARLETLAFPSDTRSAGMQAVSVPLPDNTGMASDEAQSTALADQLRALREQLDQSATLDIPANSATGTE